MILSFATVVVYGRLLEPRQFGLFAMAITAITLVGLFRDLGLAQSAIQREELSNDDRDVLFWINVSVSGISAIIFGRYSTGLAWFYGEPSLVSVLIGCAFYFFVWGLQSQHAANLRRHMRFKPILLSEVAGAICGLAVGVSTAYVRQDVWALVAANTAQALVASSLIPACRSLVAKSA